MAVRDLNENNVFRTGKILQFADGQSVLERTQIEWEGNLDDQYHIVRENDRLDRLAYSYYSNSVPDASKYWWVIADANAIENPLDLSEWVGQEILIPNIINVKLEL
jgi:hypothetical protein